MKVRLKDKVNNYKQAIYVFLTFRFFAVSLVFTLLLFETEFKNMREPFISQPSNHTVGDSILTTLAFGKVFKDVDSLNNKFSRNNDERPESLVLYRDTFLLDDDKESSGYDKPSLWKDDDGGSLSPKIYCNDFDDMLIEKCLFSSQFAVHCNFKKVVFDSSSFVRCKFMYCDFTRAVFKRSVTFKDCIFVDCIFRNTFFSAKLEDSLELNSCDLFHCSFFPINFDSVAMKWKGNNNVFYLNCRSNPIKAKLEQLGLKEDVKYLEAAEKKNLIINYANGRTRFTQHFLLGNFLNDYGTNALKPLIPIVFLLPIFFFIYFGMSFQRRIFLTWSASLKNKGAAKTYTVDLNRFVKCSSLKRGSTIFVFTFISCFSFGFSLIRGLDFQTMISAFQKRNFIFHSEGTVKLITGIQSLLVFLCFTLSVIALI